MNSHESSSIHALYFNGLTNGKTRWREKFAMRYLARRGIIVEHIPIDWRSKESFEALLGRVTKLTKARLRQHGNLAIVGVSAGGSLAVNVYNQLRDKDLTVVTLCSRLRETRLPWWDWRSLHRMAYIGTKKESRKFYDSIMYCTHNVTPNLTMADKKRFIIVQPLADTVVPRSTMSIDGVTTYTVRALGHGWGIGAAALLLPRLITSVENKSSHMVL